MAAAALALAGPITELISEIVKKTKEFMGWEGTYWGKLVDTIIDFINKLFGRLPALTGGTGTTSK